MERSPRAAPPSSRPYQSRSSISYPSPPPSESNMARSSAENALGLTECSWASPSSPLTITHLHHISDQSSQMWPRELEPPSLSMQGHTRSSQPPPDIFSSAYDPFASFESVNRQTYSDGPYQPNVGAFTDVRVSPTPSYNYSRRSSFSSPRPPSEVYSREGSESGFHPAVKVEDSSSWISSPERNSTVRTTISRQELLMVTRGSSATSLDQNAYLRGSSPEDLKYSTSHIYGDQYQNFEGDLFQLDSPHLITNATRIRKRRRMTSPSEASYKCHVCNKNCSRSYNLKTHMETHDPGRPYPHVCEHKDCGKKFVRKTDLTRHFDTVHVKQRKYKCTLCGNLFARKDTLRRHMEDGCSKRFDITSRARRDGEDAPAAMPVMTSAGIVPMRTRNSNATVPYDTTSPYSRPLPQFVLPPPPIEADPYAVARVNRM